MTEEDAQPLQESHLDEHEPETQKPEVESPAHHEMAPDLPLGGSQRQHDGCHYQQDGDEKEHQQRACRGEVPTDHAAVAKVLGEELGSIQRQDVEEEWALVGRRREIELEP